MISNNSWFVDNLPIDKILKNEIIQTNISSVRQLNRIYKKFVDDLFENANNEIQAKLPSLKVVAQKDPNSSQIKIFMRLVNHLHDKAEKLGFDEQAPKNEDRLMWEFAHYSLFLEKIQLDLDVIYPEMLNDFKKLHKFFKEESWIKHNIKMTFQQELTDYIESLINVCYRFYSERDTFLEAANTHDYYIPSYAKFKIKKENIVDLIKTTPQRIAFGYLVAKKQGLLLEFFKSFHPPIGSLLLEHTLAVIQEFMQFNLDLNSQGSSYVPLINPRETEEKNLQRFLQFFINRQLKKYAEDHQMASNDMNDLKMKVASAEDFLNYYATKTAYIEFLKNEIQVTGKIVARGELYPITDEVVESFAESSKKANLLGCKSDSRNLTWNKKETKQKNLEMMLQFFINRQLKKYAEETRIPFTAVNLNNLKTQIFDKQNFLISHATKADFIKFLTEEANVIGHETSEGPMTEDYIELFSDLCEKACLLG